MKPFNWNASPVRRLIALALAEDESRADITTQALIRPAWRVRAEIRAKQNGVVSGLPLAASFFKALSPRCRFRATIEEGAVVRRHDRLATIEGPARAILAAERPALNALQHLSGIATYTHQQLQRLAPGKTRLLDTRKTLPGWRLLEKYAVRCGGGTNHRMSLADALLIKDNHLKISRLAGADWVADLQRFRRTHSIPVQAEIQTAKDLRDVIALKPQLVLLDNMPFPALRKVIRRLRQELPRIQIEISGGVRPDELRRLSQLGVERISMGRLTHSAPAFDCSLDIQHVDAR